jgi:hypothetical protein
MSFDYYVAIRRDKWPTAAAVQAKLEQFGYPLDLEQTPDLPFSLPPDSFMVPTVLEGRSVGLEADIEQATDADDPESRFGYWAKKAAPAFEISNGDYFLALTFRDNIDQIRAGLYLAAAMILGFEGYGFENQFETHGRVDFADQLLLEASTVSGFES